MPSFDHIHDDTEEMTDELEERPGSRTLPEGFFDPQSARRLYWTRFLTREQPQPAHIDNDEDDEQTVTTTAEQRNSLDAIVDRHRKLLADGPRPPVSQRGESDLDEDDETLAGLKAPSLLETADQESPWNGTQSGTES